jgi:hypothetical protein
MIAKVTKRTELGPLRALPTARYGRVERGNRHSLTRSCPWVAVVEAHHTAIRSSSHSSMKTENWLQLRIVGVTAIREPGFGRASSIAERSRAGRFRLCLGGCCVCERGSCKCLRTQKGRGVPMFRGASS